LTVLEKEYGNTQIIDDDELVNIRDTEWYKAIRTEMTVGDVLRIRRENAGLSQEALAAKTGISQGNIAAMETGRRVIGPKVARKLAAALAVAADEFHNL
jgi:ribosome-binding protein aMBF1 (putative translation factor)